MNSVATTAPRQPPDWQAWLRLSLTPHIGRATARKLLARCGSPEAVWAPSCAAHTAGLTSVQRQALAQLPPDWSQALERTQAWVEHCPSGHCHALIALGDPRYPSSLLHTADPPLLLYAAGPDRYLATDAPWLDVERSLAIVGSRNPTPQGSEHAQRFAQHVADQGWSVISGMALGIDTAAHQGALQALRTGSAERTPPVTVAVLGTGVDVVYPARNHALAKAITEHGVLLSEFPLGTPPLASHFPQRNRILSGLSRGVLVVEAALASGSLITARTANEQGREVFAIPGSIHNPQSRGCHALIRQGAKLVETVQDILEEWSGPGFAAPAAHDASPTPSRSPLLAAMGYDPIGLEGLQARTGWALDRLQAELLSHELDGTVQRLAGGSFQRSGRA